MHWETLWHWHGLCFYCHITFTPLLICVSCIREQQCYNSSCGVFFHNRARYAWDLLLLTHPALEILFCIVLRYQDYFSPWQMLLYLFCCLEEKIIFLLGSFVEISMCTRKCFLNVGKHWKIIFHLLSSICVISFSVFSKLYSGSVAWPPGLELLSSRSFGYLETNVFEFCSKARDKRKFFSTRTFLLDKIISVLSLTTLLFI